MMKNPFRREGADTSATTATGDRAGSADEGEIPAGRRSDHEAHHTSDEPVELVDIDMTPEEAEAKAQEVLEEYDRESRTRHVSWKPVAIGLTAFAIIVSLYHMYTSYFGTPPIRIHRSLHTAAMLILAFAIYPAYKRASRSSIPLYDWVLMGLAAMTGIYMWVEHNDLIMRSTNPTTMDYVVATALVFLVIEAARRLTGWALPILAILALLYATFGRELSGMFRHRGYPIEDTFANLYMSVEGIYGTAIGVSASYIFLFVLFGAVLQRSGMGQFFNDIALALAGQSRGGPAKVAVIASGFLGSINGAAVANVVTTGAFTIPLMKKVGYNKTFAGAVEATASVGGQILPPIMGASAFIMAETLGVPYQTIAIAAIIPALLYYLGIIAQVHLRATKEGLKGISRENLPLVREVLKERGHLMIPLVFLLYMLFFSGRTVLFSALLTIIVSIIVAQFRASTRMSVGDIFGALADGAKTSVSTAIACAAVGIIVGVVTRTGFAVNLASAIVSIGAGSLLLSLMLTMIASIILGMGLPSIPTYIITATMAAPALVELGVEPLVAHMFVFYFGLFANITPPVALASFAAAGISGAEPMRTGVQSMRLALAGYVIPYLFVLSPAMLLQDTQFFDAAQVTLTGIVGVLILSVAVEGHLWVDVPWWRRILFGAGAIGMMSPDKITDIIGIAIIGVTLVLQAAVAKKEDVSLRHF